MRLFNGILISARVKVLKPDPKIFECLLSLYQLCATQTILIDDTLENVIAARQLGFATIQFKNASDCENNLRTLLGGW